MRISFPVYGAGLPPQGRTVRGPRSPPRRGPPLSHAHWPAASFAVGRSIFPGGRPPGPPGAGFARDAGLTCPYTRFPGCGFARDTGVTPPIAGGRLWVLAREVGLGTPLIGGPAAGFARDGSPFFKPLAPWLRALAGPRSVRLGKQHA